MVNIGDTQTANLHHCEGNEKFSFVNTLGNCAKKKHYSYLIKGFF